VKTVHLQPGVQSTKLLQIPAGPQFGSAQLFASCWQKCAVAYGEPSAVQPFLETPGVRLEKLQDALVLNNDFSALLILKAYDAISDSSLDFLN
jgi:hypothetical protein